MPQVIYPSKGAGGMTEIQMRVRERVSGTLTARMQGRPVWQRRLNTRPERRIAVPIGEIVSRAAADYVEFTIE